MGITYIEGVVRGTNGELKKEETVRFLVDSGATYSLLPAPVWQSIGLAAKREMSFSLADGTTVRRSVSECHILLPQGEGHTPVILGEPGDEAIQGLVFNPFSRTLHPTRMLLAWDTSATANRRRETPLEA